LEEDAVGLERGCTDGGDGTFSRYRNKWIKINEIFIQTRTTINLLSTV
jgi:hypothetical protein